VRPLPPLLRLRLPPPPALCSLNPRYAAGSHRGSAATTEGASLVRQAESTALLPAAAPTGTSTRRTTASAADNTVIVQAAETLGHYATGQSELAGAALTE